MFRAGEGDTVGGSARDRFPRRSPAADCGAADAPVLQAVEELAEVSRTFSQDGIQQRAMEQTTPAISLAGKIVEMPVIRKNATGCEHACSTRRQHS